MPWPVTYFDKMPEDMHVGDMWPAPEWEDSEMLGENYLRDWKGKRPPLKVALPSTHGVGEHKDWMDIFIIDSMPTTGDDKTGWHVTIRGNLVNGQRVNISVSPSIDMKGTYHGHIRDGMVTDDVEGRKYEGKNYPQRMPQAEED